MTYLSTTKHTLSIISLILLLFVVTACSSPAEEPTPTPTEAPEVEVTTFSVSGSGSLTPVLSSIVEAFEADNPAYLLDVLAGSGTSGGVRGTLDGTLDFAAMSRPARDTEAEEGLVFVQFGNSVTAVYAHPDVGVTDLTSEQLTDIFMGNVTNWSEVGGEDVDVVIYIRDPEEGNTVDLRETFIGEDEFVDSAQLMNSQTDMQNAVANIEGAIGYGTWATALANEAEVIRLTIDEIADEDAPDTLVTMMGLGYLSEREADVQPLLDWLLSEAGQTALEAVGVVPLESE